MPATSVINTSAPGSVMLMGEHAVLFGHRALVLAVDKRMHITLTPRCDCQVIIHSALGSGQGTLEQLPDVPALDFVLQCIRSQQACLPGGFELQIRAEFSHTVGLGSSAAVCVALLHALRRYAGTADDPAALFAQALAVIHQVQGRGSGADVAASVYGAVVGYSLQPDTIRQHPCQLPVSLYYAGYKTRTAVVLARVAQQSQHAPELYQQLYQLMHQVTVQAEQALLAQDLRGLGRLMNLYQGLLDALGVNDQTLADMVYRLRADSAVLGAKISGSGLGDCVIALGDSQGVDLPYPRIDIAVSAQGVCAHVH